MFRRTDDLRIRDVRPLIPPAILLEEIPITERASNLVFDTRDTITNVIAGHDSRLALIVGPCSIHDTKAALEYGERLKTLADRFAGHLVIVMRTYFEKPRTSVGWKGLINDPDLDGSFHINKGLRLARQLLLDLNNLGLPTASEFLDTQIPQHIADLTSWVAIGARTAESQVHRELASGLSMPVGFKNRTDGNVQVAVDAVRAAAVSHAFAGVDTSGTPAILHTTGNADGHIILRGGRDAPNHGAEGVAAALGLLRSADLSERLVVDCSHDNSGKDPARQPGVAADVGAQIAGGNGAIVGVMLESFLVGGRQDLDSEENARGPASAAHVAGSGTPPLTYGQSITDACMDWDATVTVLGGLAEADRGRRAGAAA